MKILPPVFAALLLFAFGAKAQNSNDLSDAEIQGRQLVQKILEESPSDDITNTGILEIHNTNGDRIKIPICFQIQITGYAEMPGHPMPLWLSIYQTTGTNPSVRLEIAHGPADSPNEYFFINGPGEKTPVDNVMVPFAGSDFWICDLGLEFFHWPGQKILRHETRRTRACAVLESTNPNPTPGGYSRVDTWIDNETLGIVHAEAFDASGKLLKVFDPKSFKKVNGQWELQDMEIRNVQTHSRSWIKFNLNPD